MEECLAKFGAFGKSAEQSFENWRGFGISSAMEAGLGKVPLSLAPERDGCWRGAWPARKFIAGIGRCVRNLFPAWTAGHLGRRRETLHQYTPFHVIAEGQTEPG